MIQATTNGDTIAVNVGTCGGDGKPGPAGPAGPQGPEGPIGPAGADGVAIVSAVAPPPPLVCGTLWLKPDPCTGNATLDVAAIQALVAQEVLAAAIGGVDVSGFATTASVTAALAPYYTKIQVDALLAAIPAPTPVDLSPYYTATEVDALLASLPAAGLGSDATPPSFPDPATNLSNGVSLVNPDGSYTRPNIVGGIPVVVNGTKYLIALIAG
jgi:hypothetical protein